jgi:hypothetical protein
MSKEKQTPASCQTAVSGSAYRYPMTYDQPCQIDCRVTSCKFYKGAGKCDKCKRTYFTDYEEHRELGTSETEYWLVD